MSDEERRSDGVALITGAGRGIGRALALELAGRGIETLATMRRPEQAADLAGTPHLHVARLDVTDVEAAELPPDLQVLVHNAGVDPPNRAVEATGPEVWREVFETNLFGAVDLTRRAVPLLRANGGGVIVVVTSVSVPVPMPFFSLYRAAKAALAAFAESLAAEVVPFGIRVLEVLPGPVATEMLDASATVPEEVGPPAYAALGAHVAALRAAMDGDATPVGVVATAIADAIVAAWRDPDQPPHVRMAPDPTGEALLESWQAQDDRVHRRGYLDAFALPPDAG